MRKSYLFALTSILIWSTLATISKLLLNHLNSIYVLCISSFFASIFLLIVCVLTGRIKIIKNYRIKDYIITIFIGIPGTFIYYLFYYLGSSYLCASQAFIINYLWPIMSVIFACIILKESVTYKKIIAIILSFSGVFFVAGNIFSVPDSGFLWGVLFCLFAAVSYGLYTVLTQLTNYDKIVSMMFFYLTSFVLSGLILVFIHNEIRASTLEWIGMAYNGIAVMAIASTTWLFALEGGKTAKISNLAYITPFLSLIWTYLVLKEEVSMGSFIGLFLIIIGIVIQLFRVRNK